MRISRCVKNAEKRLFPSQQLAASGSKPKRKTKQTAHAGEGKCILIETPTSGRSTAICNHTQRSILAKRQF